MKRKSVIATALILAVLLPSCAKTPDVVEPGPETEIQRIEMSVDGGNAQERLPYCEAIDYTVSRPDVDKAAGATHEVVFYRDGNPIYGKITHPQGMGPFKTIVISNGLYAPLGRYSNKAEAFCAYGYAVVEFNFQNNIPPEDYTDPEYLGDFIFEQVSDLCAVIDSLTYFQYLDTSNVYIYGHSMGGLVASYVGTYRKRDISGLLLVDPSFYAADIMWFEKEPTITTDIYSLFSQCNIPVVIFTGTAGSFGEDPNFFDDARAAFPDCEYVVIEGATHIFEGDASWAVVEAAVEMIDKWEQES